MIPALVSVGLAAAGLLLLLGAPPFGRPRPRLAEQLARLQPTRGDPASAAEAAPVFATPGLDRVLLPPLRAAGGRLSRLAARAGVDVGRRARELTLVSDRGGVAVYYGQQLLLGLLGVGAVPLLAALGLGFLAPWPVWTWLALAAAAAVTPVVSLRVRVERLRQRLAGEVAVAAEYLALAVSAGLGLEQALNETATAGAGRLFAHLRLHLARARLARQPGTAALRALAEEIDLPELSALAGALQASHHYGTPLTGTLRAQAEAIRARRRLALLAAGQRAGVLMLLPVALLILPALLLVLLFPVAANLLQLTTP